MEQIDIIQAEVDKVRTKVHEHASELMAHRIKVEDMMKIQVQVGRIEEKITNLDCRINGSMDAIEKHMTMGNAWRMAIVGNVVMIVMQIICFAYLWGAASKQITVNTERLGILEAQERALLCGKP